MLPHRNPIATRSAISGGSRRRLLGAAGIATALLIMLGLSTAATACPRCADGQAARREVYSDGFWRNLATLLLPFSIVGAVSARMHTIGRSRPPKNAAREGS